MLHSPFLRLALILACCFFSTEDGLAAETVEVAWGELRDVENERLSIAAAKWKVVCFLGVECPLARLYGPRLQRLSREFADQGVRFVGINSNLQDSPADIKQYSRQHQISFPIVKDARQSLAKQFGAKRTPEVFVVDSSNHVRYRGRIDDQYEPGLSRSAPTRHDLRAAIASVLAGKKAPVALTEAVGCLITFRKSADHAIAPTSAVTFAGDIAPLLNRHCVECHREGEIGPFALIDYDEVIGWGQMMLEVIEQNRMPPWHADPKHGEFVGARRVPQSDRETLAAWVEQGMPLGNKQDLPPKPKRAGGWHLPSPPDVVLNMRERPFVVPPEGTVEYQYFVVDPNWEADRWVRAAQVLPGNTSVVHHSIVFVRPPDGSSLDGVGWMGGYVPGQRAAALPPGHARLIPARSKLVFQMHYTPNGRQTDDVTRVGVWFSKPDQVTHKVTTRIAINHDFEIPPGAKDYAVDLDLDGFASDARLLGVMPHMHLRGKSFRLDAHRLESDETLLSVPEYDFNWQHFYQLQTPLALKDVDVLRMQARFDNSADNVANPDPESFVSWGDQTWQEMAVAFLDIGHPRGKPRVVQRRTQTLRPEQLAERQRRIEQETEKFLASLDRNGDGVVERDETPEAFRRFGFYRMDHNRNGRLERSEIEAESTRRLGP